MESAEIEQRIRAMHLIDMAAMESEEDFISLVDIILPAAEFMTREELIEQLRRVCEAYDKQSIDHRVFRANEKLKEENMHRELEEERRMRREAEAARTAAENEVKAKDAIILDQDKTIKEMSEALEDVTHTSQSLKQEKFASKSKRGIDNVKGTSKGRDDDKDDFDGTPESVAPVDNTVSADGNKNTGAASDSNETEDISMDDFKKKHKVRPSKYKLADASVKVVHECDLSRLPEGAVPVPGSESEVIIFNEERIIRADVYKFIKYRILEQVVNEDGEVEMRWREHTMHFPVIKDGKGDNPTGETTPVDKKNLPLQVPGTHESPAMLSHLLLEHYFGNVPMNRISNAFAEFGFDIRRQTLEGLDAKIAEMLQPLHDALLDEVLCDDGVIFCDETWYRLHLKEGTKKVYDWILANKKAKAVAYVYDNGSRGRKVIVEVLEGRNVKAIHTDAYNAYFFLEDTGVVHILCGAHVWRKIKEWYERTHDPEAKALLLDLGSLFQMDAKLREDNEPPNIVYDMRNSPKTIDTINRFTARVELLLSTCKEIPKIGFKALNYAKEAAAKMFRWRENSDYELDNNTAERAARGVATSRKTSMHHCSHDGAKNDCIIRSFVETCRLRDVSIVEWFKAFFHAMIQGRTDYPNLLPGVLPLN